ARSVDPAAGRAVVAERRLSPLRDARGSGLRVGVRRDPGILAVARRAEAAVEEVELLELAGRPRRATRGGGVGRRADEPVRGAGHGERDLLRRDRRAVDVAEHPAARTERLVVEVEARREAVEVDLAAPVPLGRGPAPDDVAAHLHLDGALG